MTTTLEEHFRQMEDPYEVTDGQADVHIEDTDETMLRRFLVPVMIFGALLVFFLFMLLPAR